MPETESPAAKLRRAASLIRERVALVPPSPWYPLVHDVTTYDGLNVIATSGLTVRTQYVASWHPAVALAVADWLVARAAEYDEYSSGPYGEAGAAFVAGNAGGDIDPALAVARAYLDTERPVRAQLEAKTDA